MRIAGQNGILTMLHAENGDVIDILVAEALAAGHTAPEWHAHTRPAWGAVEAVLRGAALATQAQAPLYVVHMNVAGEVDQLEYARQSGLPVMGETCPQYLFFNESHLSRPDGAKWICSPPMRLAEDNERLWEGLENRTMQVVATDHCPFFYEGSQGKLNPKARTSFRWVPNGIPGVETRLPILYSKGVAEGRITVNEFVALTSTNHAKIYGLYPHKGSIGVGFDADIVLWDPNRKETISQSLMHHNSDYTPYEGLAVTGWPVMTILRGSVVCEEGRILGAKTDGRFLKRSLSPYAVPSGRAA